MSREEDLWEQERSFWLGGADYYRWRLADEAILRLPGPVGQLSRQEIVESIEGASRSLGVRFEAELQLSLGSEIRLMSYQAEATREGQEDPYRAKAINIYQRNVGSWLPAFQQQVPAIGGVLSMHVARGPTW